MAITLSIDLTQDLGRVEAWSATLKKQFPFAASQALNATAFDARKSINASTRQYFDRPTTFIQNAYRVEKSTKRTLTAIVFPEAKRQPYLLRNITGGQRGSKPFEAKLIGASSGAIESGSKLLPVGLKRNAQGNVSLAALKRLTGQIGPTGRNSVFIGTPKGGNRPPGVYQRVGQKLKPLFVSLPSATYRPIFPVQEIGAKVAKRRFGGYLRSSLEKALASAR